MSITFEKYVGALAGGRVEYGLKEVKGRLETFFDFLDEATPGLAQMGIEVIKSEWSGPLRHATFNTPLGAMEMKSVSLLDGEYLGVGITFTDAVVGSGLPVARKLYAVQLGSEGHWHGSDGKVVADWSVRGSMQGWTKTR